MSARIGGGHGVIAKPGAPAPSSTDPDTNGAKVSKHPRRVLSLEVGTGVTINAGDSVVFDLTGDAQCRVVELSDADTATHEALYVGVCADADGTIRGGSGAETTRSGFSGKKGAAGDLIEITVSGVCKAWCLNASATAAVGDTMQLNAQAGTLDPNGTAGSDDVVRGALLQAMTTTEEAGKLVLLRGGL